VVIDFKGQIQF
jgi:hypothetical protein